MTASHPGDAGAAAAPGKHRVHIISASAGSGKTYRLAMELQNALAGPAAVLPENVLATTFTNKAAAELQERVRQHLLEAGRLDEAQRLAAARIGTVNAVCGRLVSDFAFDLGLPPDQLVLDEPAARLALRRALSRVITVDESLAIAEIQERLPHFIVLESVRRAIEQARANGIAPERLAESAERSLAEVRALLSPPAGDAAAGEAIDAALRRALEALEDAGRHTDDATKTTRESLERAGRSLARLKRGLGIPWDEWAALERLELGKRSGMNDAAEPLRQCAARYLEHPRLHEDLRCAIHLVFSLAARGLTAYTAHKTETGTLDFIDQETKALELLERANVRERLRGELGLVLIDEFQDTSPLQLAIFLRLAELAPRSIWVGDQKQSIYAFRGSDPDLLESTMAALLGGGDPETLRHSWRSRPELVHLTSDIFGSAFGRQGLPADRVRLVPSPRMETEAGDKGLGPVIERWHLIAKNQTDDADALAAAVREMLTDETVRVRDPISGQLRSVKPADVAVLCRKRVASGRVATALANLGVRAFLPRVGLLAAPEGQLALAGLRLWADPRDRLAAATIARLAEMPADGAQWLEAALAAPQAEAFFALPRVQRLLAARRSGAYTASTAGPLSALDAVVDALDLRGLCADWGETPARIANLDALRAHAEIFAESCAAEGAAATPAGLVLHLETLLSDDQDQQASVATDDAVTVSTWHAAKGLEWPIVVLFELESDKAPTVFGLSAQREGNTDSAFDFSDPLGRRWLRLWPEIFHANRTTTAVHARLARDPIALLTQERRDREELRLLYVGWTRARDRIVLAGRPTRFLDGALRHLRDKDGNALLTDHPTEPRATWAGRAVDRLLRHASPLPREPRSETPGSILAAAGPRRYPPAYSRPSGPSALPASPDVPAPAQYRVGSVETLGNRLSLRGDWDERRLGEAFHRFFAADLHDLTAADRDGLAHDLVECWGLAEHLDAAHLLTASDRLRAWAERSWPATTAPDRWRREWPVQHLIEAPADLAGTVVRGAADLVLEWSHELVVVDHKTFAGSREQALTRAVGFGGQVWGYARALSAATGKRVAGGFLHLPVLGCLIRLAPAADEVGAQSSE